MDNFILRYVRKELKQGKTFISFTFLKILGELSLFLIPLTIAKFFEPEGFGSYSLSMMIVYFFSALLIAPSQTPFIIYSNEELKKTDKISRAFTIQIMFFSFSIFIFLLLIAIFNDPLSNFASITKTQILFMIFAYLGVSIRTAFQGLFMAFDKKIENAVYTLITGIILLTSVLVLYYFFTLNIENIFIMFFVSSVLSSLIMIKRVDFDKIFPLVFDKNLLKEIFNFTKWQMFGFTAGYFINWGDNLVLRYFVSMEEIGVYNLGYQIFKGLITLTYIINSYYLPFISQNIDDKEKIRDYLHTKRPKIMLVGVLGLGSIFIAVPFIFNLIYGEVYEGSIIVLRVLIIALFFKLYSVFYTPLFNSLKRYRFTQMANILQITANLLLDVLFVFLFGLIGAAIATTICYIARFVATEIYYRTRIRKLYTSKPPDD